MINWAIHCSERFLDYFLHGVANNFQLYFDPLSLIGSIEIYEWISQLNKIESKRRPFALRCPLEIFEFNNICRIVFELTAFSISILPLDELFLLWVHANILEKSPKKMRLKSMNKEMHSQKFCKRKFFEAETLFTALKTMVLPKAYLRPPMLYTFIHVTWYLRLKVETLHWRKEKRNSLQENNNNNLLYSIDVMDPWFLRLWLLLQISGKEVYELLYMLIFLPF